MKNLLLSLLSFFIVVSASSAQGVKANENLNEDLRKNLKYPDELRSNEIQGPVSLLIGFDQEGKINSAPEVLAGNENLAEEVIRVLHLVQSGKSTDLVAEDYYGQDLILNVNFRITSGNSQQINLPITEQKILKDLNEKIAQNPYFPSYYLERAKLYEEMEKTTLAELDRAFYHELKEKELTNVVVVGYQTSDKKLSFSME
ncbi:hypothetical protein [Algoriphagus hitonicola]|uniref:TonB protein C-terminal n=1 Tax=Algoriphagus hitonicola TaxID=435880 RepID=A0A1I2QH97_9BACT|nr:hypothetical protein [Algoriphagus hitonicola]SFG27023.1 hypothetical protein SAMN04487988_102255 [Algoriphagus hitonicola]